MKLLILGGTGATGRLLVDAALAAGHEVTALARDPAQLDVKHERLQVRQGRATVAAELAPVVAGHDAVASTLGPRTKKDAVCPATADALVPAMQQHGVKRLVWMSASGVGDSLPTVTKLSWFFGKLIIPLFLRQPYANHAKAEDRLRASGLDVTIVRPLQLVAKSRGKPVRATLPDEPLGGSKITRAEVAAWMLGELERAAFVGKLPLLWT